MHLSMCYILFIILILFNLIHASALTKTNTTNVDDDEEVCPICYENFKDHIQPLNLDCKHALCTQCWLDCIAQDIQKCPICRDPNFLNTLCHDFTTTLVNFTNLLYVKNYTTIQLDTILYHSTTHGNLDLCKILLFDHKIDLNKPYEYSKIIPLHHIIKSKKMSSAKKVQIFQYFVENTNVNVGAKTFSGVSILHYASFFVDFGLLKYILENDLVPVDDTDDDENTAIMYVLRSNTGANKQHKLAICKYLVEKHNASLTIVNSQNMSPLIYSIKLGYFHIFNYIIEKTKITDSHFLFHNIFKHAITEEEELMFFQLLVKNKKIDIESQTERGRALIHTAAHFGSFDILKFASKFFDVNQQDHYGNTALMYVLYSEEIEDRLKVIQFLIEKLNANVNIQNENKLNALFIALQNGNFLIVKYLLEETNIDLNLRDVNGNNFLMFLIKSNVMKMKESKLSYVRYLIQNVNVSAVNNVGSTILHISAETGNINIFNYLIENTNLSLNEKNLDGTTPPMYVITSQQMNHTVTFDFLKQIVVQNSFDVNTQDFFGWTILHHTLFFGYFKMSKHILEFTKINVHAKDLNGDSILATMFISPYLEYGAHGRFEMVQILIEQYNVSVSDENKDGQTLLHIAAKTGSIDLLNYLKKTQKLDVNKKDINKNTPLLLLLENCQLSELEIFRTVVDLVIYHHAKLDVENIDGNTAHKICVLRKFYMIANYIMTSFIDNI